MFRIYLFIVIAAILFTSCRDSKKDTPSTTQFSEPLIVKILEVVRQEYVDKPNELKMLEGALNGMLRALDPYSCFLNTESYKVYTQSARGEFGGLGMEVVYGQEMIKVISPMDDMPAQKAGIKAGDLITHIDDIHISKMTLEDVLKYLHGKPGSAVSLKIHRGMAAPFTIKITREFIVVNPIKYRIDGNIAYVRISSFNDQTTEKLTAALKAISKSVGKDLHGLILDLRNNPGGMAEQAFSVASLFLDSGMITHHVKRRDAAYHQTFKAKGKDLLRGIPLAVLINKGSASASEIVAAALRDNHRAVLIGEKTFGKGSIQASYPLENYGGIKITIARFYTPKGEEIQGHGIQPDIFLSPPPVAAPQIEHTKDAGSEDKEYQRAIDLLQGLWAIKTRT
ncbi:MAG: S41 family peptidase [Alphaproteobacteria bacterium]|nr:S41 family peptidase [Alphaproteobacteria bacterium]